MAATRRKKTMAHPFVFFDHGVWNHEDEIKSVAVQVVFARDVPEELRALIAAGAPAPMRCHWPMPSLMAFGPEPGDYFDAQVARAHGGKALDAEAGEEEDDEPAITAEMVQSFCDALDAWLLDAHARAPITVVLGWIGAARHDAWAEWSTEAAFEHALPRLLAVQRDLLPLDDTAAPLRIELARLAYEVVAARFARLTYGKLGERPAAEQALAKSTLRAVLGKDELLDGSARFLYRYLTGELLTDGLDEQAARALFRRHGVAWPA